MGDAGGGKGVGGYGGGGGEEGGGLGGVSSVMTKCLKSIIIEFNALSILVSVVLEVYNSLDIISTPVVLTLFSYII